MPKGKRIFKWIETISVDVVEAQQNGTKLPFWKNVQYCIIDTLIFSQIRKRFGQRYDICHYFYLVVLSVVVIVSFIFTK